MSPKIGPVEGCLQRYSARHSGSKPGVLDSSHLSLDRIDRDGALISESSAVHGYTGARESG